MTDGTTDWQLVAATRGIELAALRKAIDDALFFLESEQDGGVTLEMRIANAVDTLQDAIDDPDGETSPQKSES